jgi:hypothetical protein
MSADVLEKQVISIFRVKEEAKQETSGLLLQLFFDP